MAVPFVWNSLITCPYPSLYKWFMGQGSFYLYYLMQCLIGNSCLINICEINDLCQLWVLLFKNFGLFLSKSFLWVYCLPFNVVYDIILICTSLISNKTEDIFLMFTDNLYFFFLWLVHIIYSFFHWSVCPLLLILSIFYILEIFNLFSCMV